MCSDRVSAFKGEVEKLSKRIENLSCSPSVLDTLTHIYINSYMPGTEY